MNERIKRYCWELMNGKSKGVLGLFIGGVLFCLSGLYLIGVKIAFFCSRNTFRSSRKVISVGNITVGGVGKTPFVVYLARLLERKGKRAVIVTRGYMPKESAFVQSDEVLMLKEILLQTPVLVGKDRAENMTRAEVEHPEGAFILDDGFQHWKVARDLDIVLIDARAPFGNGRVLPAGILREPLSALRRADGFVLTHCDEGENNVASLKSALSSMNPSAFVMGTVHAVTDVVDLVKKRTQPLSVLKDNVLLCTAIARPDAFIASVKRLGADIRHQEIFLDHHAFTVDDATLLARRCREKGLKKVVVTHKDAVKLASFASCFDGISMLVLNMEIKVLYGEDEFISSIDRLLDA